MYLYGILAVLWLLMAATSGLPVAKRALATTEVPHDFSPLVRRGHDAKGKSPAPDDARPKVSHPRPSSPGSSNWQEPSGSERPAKKPKLWSFLDSEPVMDLGMRLGGGPARIHEPRGHRVQPDLDLRLGLPQTHQQTSASVTAPVILGHAVTGSHVPLEKPRPEASHSPALPYTDESYVYNMGVIHQVAPHPGASGGMQSHKTDVPSFFRKIHLKPDSEQGLQTDLMKSIAQRRGPMQKSWLGHFAYPSELVDLADGEEQSTEIVPFIVAHATSKSGWS